MQVGEQHEKPTSLCVFLSCDLNQVKENVLGISAISKNKNGGGERVDNLILCFLAFQGLIFEPSYCFMKAFFVVVVASSFRKNKHTKYSGC